MICTETAELAIVYAQILSAGLSILKLGFSFRGSLLCIRNKYKTSKESNNEH